MDNNKNYQYKISMELFGQILFAIQGHPDKSSNQKQHIFGKYYDDVFSEEKFNISEAPNIIRNYFAVKAEYNSANNSIQKIEQKVFYVMYMKACRPDMQYSDCIRLLEHALLSFETDNTMTDSRKLIHARFKEHLNSQLDI